MHTPTRLDTRTNARAHPHTHTNMQYILLSHGSNDSRTRLIVMLYVQYLSCWMLNFLVCNVTARLWRANNLLWYLHVPPDLILQNLHFARTACLRVPRLVRGQQPLFSYFINGLERMLNNCCEAELDCLPTAFNQRKEEGLWDNRVCACACVSIFHPFRLFEQLTDFDETWYEDMPLEDTPALYFLISCDEKYHNGAHANFWGKKAIGVA